MGTRTMRKELHRHHQKSQTLPPSPTHSFSSSSSSDFEFTISVSPRKSSTALCPADELFYKGQLLPLHLSPRISMVRTLLLPPSSAGSYSSSSDTTTSRDSTGSSSNESRDSSASSFASDLLLLDHSCDSSRPSSAADDTLTDDPPPPFKRFNAANKYVPIVHGNDPVSKKKYFSLSRFSSVFKKEAKVHKDNTTTDHHHHHNNPGISGSSNINPPKPKRISKTAKEVISKYLKKVKPLYEKLSQKQQQKMGGAGGGEGLSIIAATKTTPSASTLKSSEKYATRNCNKDVGGTGGGTNIHGLISHSFSGNLRYPRRRGCVSSCPSSMRGSPTHSGVLSRTSGLTGSGSASGASTSSYGDRSSMEELQSAIQGAIAHCKNSLVQSKSGSMVSHEI